MLGSASLAALRSSGPGRTPSSSKQRLAFGQLSFGRLAPTRARQTSDQQLLAGLIQRVLRDEVLGELSGKSRVARRQPHECLVVRHCPGGAIHLSAHHAEPGLEHGARGERHALEQLALGESERHLVTGSSEGDDVDRRVRRKSQLKRVAGDSIYRAERPSQVGQAPAQCPQWIVSLREQHPGDAAAWRRALA